MDRRAKLEIHKLELVVPLPVQIQGVTTQNAECILRCIIEENGVYYESFINSPFFYKSNNLYMDILKESIRESKLIYYRDNKYLITINRPRRLDIFFHKMTKEDFFNFIVTRE